MVAPDYGNILTSWTNDSTASFTDPYDTSYRIIKQVETTCGNAATSISQLKYYSYVKSKYRYSYGDEYGSYTGCPYWEKNNTSTAWITPSWDYPKKPKTRSERLREILQARNAPIVLGTRRPIVLAKDATELRARETLRRVIGEGKYRNFLRSGFVSVKGKSGAIYQIFPNSHYTNVYRNGIMVERLCVVLRGNFPPTDSLIMRYLLILNDEADFRSYANVFSAVSPKRNAAARDLRSLPEIYRELRVAG